MDQPSPCPSDEELAVFLDGTLDTGRRSAFLAHLADCNDCAVVLAGAAAVKAAVKQNPTPDLYLSGPKRLADILTMRGRTVQALVKPRARPGLSRSAGVAAALLLAAGVALLMPSHRGPLNFPPAHEVASALGEAGEMKALTLQLWPGAGEARSFGGALSPAKTSFRLGVGMVDLQVSIAAGDFVHADEVVSRFEPLLDGPAEQASLAAVRQALERREAGSAAEAATALAIVTERRLPAQPASFGRWAESGRLAALGRTPGFFERPEVRGFMRDLHLAPSPPIERELKRLSDGLRHPPSSAADYAALAHSFEQILLLN
ncbi:MAG: zf-HC2 domain-containing protein [Acidobacteriota bacterium]